MDEERARYRQATLKEKLIITKKFSKFYFNGFTPITRLEEADV